MGVPTLDLSKHGGPAAKDLISALETDGFVTIVNHGIDIASVWSASRHFFELSEVDKMRSLYRDHSSNRGYTPVGLESHSSFVTYDMKESFAIGKEGEPGLTTPWPTALKDNHFRDPLLKYWKSCNEIHLKVLALIGAGLNLKNENHFVERCDQEHCNLRLTHYPRLEEDDAVVIKAHHAKNSRPIVYEDRATTFGTLVLIAQGARGGLRVFSRQKKKWEDVVSPTPDALILVVGDMLERWTNGRLRAAPHEVVSMKHTLSTGAADGDDVVDIDDTSEYSVFFFCNANKAVEIEPICLDGDRPKHVSVNALDYLTERLSVTIETGEQFPTDD